jgi:hypothetical protein
MSVANLSEKPAKTPTWRKTPLTSGIWEITIIFGKTTVDGFESHPLRHRKLSPPVQPFKNITSRASE